MQDVCRGRELCHCCSLYAVQKRLHMFQSHKILTIHPHCHFAYFTALTPRPCGTAVTVCSNYILDTNDFWFDIQMLRSDSQPLTSFKIGQPVLKPVNPFQNRSTRFKTLVDLLQNRPALLRSRAHTLHASPCIAQ